MSVYCNYNSIFHHYSMQIKKIPRIEMQSHRLDLLCHNGFQSVGATTPSITSRAIGSIYCVTTDFNPLKPPPPRISSAVGTMHNSGKVSSIISAEPTALFASYLSYNNGLKSVVDKLVEATPLLLGCILLGLKGRKSKPLTSYK